MPRRKKRLRVGIHSGCAKAFLLRGRNCIGEFGERFQQRALQRLRDHFQIELDRLAVGHQARLNFSLGDGQIRGSDGLVHPARQRAQAGDLIFVILDRVCGRNGRHAEDIQMAANELIDAVKRGNNVRVRDLVSQLPIQEPVAQPILPGKRSLRDGLQAAKKLLQ